MLKKEDNRRVDVDMPIINIKLLKGRTVEQKRNLIQEMSRVVVETTGAKLENVMITIDELEPENLGTAGIQKSDQL
mgnify:CR=1 FL=1